MKRDVVFVDAVSPPFGRMGGTLKDFFNSKLAGIGLEGLFHKTGILEKAKVDTDKWNPNGASGARVGMLAMRELIRRGGWYGFFSSCYSGGLGVVTLIENLKR